MERRWRTVSLIGWLLMLAGCSENDLWPGGIGPVQKLPSATTNETVARRVDVVGKSLIAANPQLPVKPVFVTVGSPAGGSASPSHELFHQPQGHIFITEALVQRCPTDAHLKALLAAELGQVVAEKLARDRLTGRDGPLLPPTQPVRPAIAGADGPADMTDLAEMARYDRQRKQQEAMASLPLPDARSLAVAYLQRAGGSAADLDAVTPLLQDAAAQNRVQRQFQNQPSNPRSP